MSALDIAQISECLRRISASDKNSEDDESDWDEDTSSLMTDNDNEASLESLPAPLLRHILSFCDPSSRDAAATASKAVSAALDATNDNQLLLSELPADVLLTLFKYLPRQSLGRVAQVCTRFRDLAYSDCLWISSSRQALAANQLDHSAALRCHSLLDARDKVRLGAAWSDGRCLETLLTVQNKRYMPRLQLESQRLWVSWGSRIWCHPRHEGGGVARASTRMLRGHADDVSKFVVKSGMVVSGGRDMSMCGWDAERGDLLFARRYCHRGEVTAVDVAAGGTVLVTGSRDKTVIVWAVHEDPHRCDWLLPVPVHSLHPGDRVWSTSCSSSSLLAVGTSATRGTPPLRLYDLASGHHLQDMGLELKNGAGMLDMAWLSDSTLLSCGYDTFTRLWDTRCRSYVRSWEEPFDESVYCLATDNVNVLVTGTARHGRVRVWDMRCTSHLYMKYAAPARRGQSSPVYSIAVDSANLYVALDQSLNLFNFSGSDPKIVINRRRRRY